MTCADCGSVEIVVGTSRCKPCNLLYIEELQAQIGAAQLRTKNAEIESEKAKTIIAETKKKIVEVIAETREMEKQEILLRAEVARLEAKNEKLRKRISETNSRIFALRDPSKKRS